MRVSLKEGYSREASSGANRPAFKSQRGKDKGGPEGTFEGYFDKISNRSYSSEW